MKQKNKLGKRGFIVDSILMIVLLFMIAIAAIIIYFFMGQMNDVVQNAADFNANAKTQMSNATNRMDNVFDYNVLVLFIGVFSALLITSFVLRTNPLLFSIVLLVVAFIGAVAGYLSNSYAEVTTGTTFAATATNFPVTNFLMNNYLVLTVIVMFAMMIVFFAKPNDGGYT